jgi:hypothetical protein
MAAAIPHGIGLAQPVAGLNHVIAYGQSLSTGWQGWPALSLRARGDSLMLGRSVRPAGESAPAFVPVGDRALHPLVATVQDHEAGVLLSEEQVAGLPEDSPALGETVLEAAVDAYRAGLLAERGAAAAPALVLASACGVGGRTLEALSRGAGPELFNRLRDCVTLGRQAAARRGATYQVLALLLLQGEHNSWALDGGTADRAHYRTMMVRLYHDMVAELAQGRRRRRRCSPTRPAAPMPPTSSAWRWPSSTWRLACPAVSWSARPTRSPTRAGTWMPTAIAGWARSSAR